MAKKKKSSKKTTPKKVRKKPSPKKKVLKKSTKAKKSAVKKRTSKKTVSKKAKKLSRKALAQAKATVKTVLKRAQKTVQETVEKVKQSLPQNSDDHKLIGSMAPNLRLQNQNGQEINLGDLIENNTKVVLYFYPKDDTPGCTTEACNFRDNFNRIQQTSAVVVGVSPDSPESHKKFAEKFGLNFDLLADTDKALCEAFQVWKEKSFMGKKYMGVERSTFLFHNGRVVKAWQPVKVDGHVDEVLSAVEALG